MSREAVCADSVSGEPERANSRRMSVREASQPRQPYVSSAMVAATIVGVGAIVQAAFEEAAEERELRQQVQLAVDQFRKAALKLVSQFVAAGQSPRGLCQTRCGLIKH